MIKKTVKIATLICALLLTAYITYFLSNNQNQTINVTVLEAKIQEISELATVEYNYTDLGKYENYTDFYGWKVPFTTSKFIITYDGKIKAGFDLTSTEITLNDETITVILDNPKIISHEIDYDSMQVIDESYSIFNKVTITQFNEFYKEQAQQIEQKAIDKGLLISAKENGEKFISNLINQLTDKEYNIIFRYK
ncbi:MAG: DUF4230 domain-containing protein [Erysipelotrichia bacterium]|nr:DUF4230 domain-containing protein [Erysipelotrichia bacterium]